MSCVMYVCLTKGCDHACTIEPPMRICPKCGERMTIEFDEWADHDEPEEFEEGEVGDE